jgi:hypothetical protein
MTTPIQKLREVVEHRLKVPGPDRDVSTFSGSSVLKLIQVIEVQREALEQYAQDPRGYISHDALIESDKILDDIVGK